MVMTEQALADFKAHALQAYPQEACGVLVNDHYIRCTNVAQEPTSTFQISARELAEVAVTKGKVQAILHSHPYRLGEPQKMPPETPSHNDMAQWLKSDIPWGIAATEGEHLSPLVWLDESVIAPVEGRPFVHGVWDCYAVVRDWFRLERGITLPNFPRGMDWWDKGHDHYSVNFQKAGFIEVSRDQVQVGDCCLMQVRSPVINHAAVITGSNEILHHLFHRLSGRDRFDRWERMVSKYVRYTGNT